MSQFPQQFQLPPQSSSFVWLFLRALWIAVQLFAVLVLIQQGGTFFYQGF